MKKSYSPETIVMSGVTDPYQPVERKLRITRKCLEVLAEFRNPVGIITKNHLVTRDIDVLRAGRAQRGAVNLSITTLDEKLQRVMEPRTSIPKRRLMRWRSWRRPGSRSASWWRPSCPASRTRRWADILKAARDAGAKWAGYVMLRLPHAVAPLFEDWLTHHFPDRKEKVLNRVRAMRGGRLYDSTWGERGRGTGEMADQIGALFRAARRKAGYDEDTNRYALSTASFRRPASVTPPSRFGRDRSSLPAWARTAPTWPSSPDPTTQAYLIRSGPWFRTPYIGQHGWVSITNPGDADRDELADLITDAWRLAAPKTLSRRIE
jgi:DNA repair photolyase